MLIQMHLLVVECWNLFNYILSVIISANLLLLFLFSRVDKIIRLAADCCAVVCSCCQATDNKIWSNHNHPVGRLAQFWSVYLLIITTLGYFFIFKISVLVDFTTLVVTASALVYLLTEQMKKTINSGCNHDSDFMLHIYIYVCVYFPAAHRLQLFIFSRCSSLFHYSLAKKVKNYPLTDERSCSALTAVTDVFPVTS